VVPSRRGPDIRAYAYTDVSLSYRANFGGHAVTPFFTVENLFDEAPPIVGYMATNPGLEFPSPAGFDVFGRTFTAGLRFELCIREPVAGPVNLPLAGTLKSGEYQAVPGDRYELRSARRRSPLRVGG
jgi:hypothetical protein